MTQDGGVDPERVEASRTIPAPPAAIFRVLCDPDGHVDIDSSGMLMAASGDLVRGVGYRLEPVSGGTLVTSYCDWSDIDPVWRERNIFPIISAGALRATLGILARTVARRAVA
jgi:hypothetical protein